MELVLEFREPVAQHQASQSARRVLESVQVAAADVGAADLEKCRLVCHDLRQAVPLITPPGSRE